MAAKEVSRTEDRGPSPGARKGGPDPALIGSEIAGDAGPVHGPRSTVHGPRLAAAWRARLHGLGTRAGYLSPLAAAGQRLRHEILGSRPVAPGIRQVRVVGSSVLLLLDEDAVTVVDTGSRGSLRLIRAGLRRAGRSLRSVRRIVLTHYHPDHVGDLAELLKATGAPVWIHAIEAPYLAGERPYPNPFGTGPLGGATERLAPLFMPGPVPVERALSEGDVVPAAGGLTVLHTPGHTPGSISLWQPARRWLFVADALQVIRGRLTLPSRFFSEDMAAARASIRKLAELEPATLCFSHYRPLTDRVADRLRDLAAAL